MKKRIFIFFSCCLLFLQLSITAFAGVPDGEFSDWYNSTNQPYSLTDLSSIYYAASMSAGNIKPPFDLGDDFSEKKAIFFFSTDYSRLSILYLSNDTESVLFNTADEVFSSDGTLKFISRTIDYDNSSFTSGSSTLTGDSSGIDITSAHGFGEFIYSSVDIYDQDGNLYYGTDDIDTFGTNDNWFTLTVNPNPQENWDLSFSYTKPDGSTVTESELKLYLTVKQVERQYKESNTELANKEKECFVFISTQPCVNGDYSAALDSCVYLHAYETSYYTDVVLNMDRWLGQDNSYVIDAETSYGANVGIDVNEKLDFAGIPHSKTLVSEYVQNYGYTTLARLNLDNDAQFTIDLNNVNLVEGQTYYVNCVAFATPLSLARGISYWPVEKFGLQMSDETTFLNFAPSLWGVNGSTEAQISAAYGVSSAPFSFAEGSLKSLGHKYDKLDCGFDNSTYSDSNLTAGTPQSSIHTGVNIDGTTYQGGLSNPSDSFNSSDGFSIVKLAGNFVPFVSASLEILPEPLGSVITFAIIAFFAAFLVILVFNVFKWLLG